MSDGYLTSIPYTPGVYPEANPLWLRWISTAQRVRPPGRAFRYLDLGAGHMRTALAVAATWPDAEVVGVDFNPDHVASARRVADGVGLPNFQAVHASFSDLPDLGSFDYVVSHGVVAWLKPEPQAALYRAIERHLGIGGLLYLSYNANPGRTASMPVQRLIADEAARHASGARDRLSRALDLVGRLADHDAGFFAQNPSAKAHFDGARKRDRTYLAHEYLNAAWQPLWFADVAERLRELGARFVGSTDALANYDRFGLTPNSLELLRSLGISDADPFKETVRDFLRNAAFRRDIFVRGRLPLGGSEREDQLLAQRYGLARDRAACNRVARIPAGELTLKDDDYEPLLDRLAAGPATGHELAELLNRSSDLTRMNLEILVGIGYATPLLSETEEAASRIEAFNAWSSTQIEEDEVLWLGPRTGEGLRLSRLDSLALQAIRLRPDDPPQWCLHRLHGVGHRLVTNGRRLEDDAEEYQEMKAVFERFAGNLLGRCRRAGLLR